jgi:hypothetical protein
MKQLRMPCPKERLLLEYRLLVAGKILPDAGSTAAHIQERLEQIAEQLRAITSKANKPDPEIDHLFVGRITYAGVTQAS